MLLVPVRGSSSYSLSIPIGKFKYILVERIYVQPLLRLTTLTLVEIRSGCNQSSPIFFILQGAFAWGKPQGIQPEVSQS
jgi:hypothetical protein